MERHEQIYAELLTIRKRLGCIGAMIAAAFTLVFVPACLFIVLYLGSCSVFLNEAAKEIEKFSLPKSAP
ncbi:MAG TPA: hypothetical protein DDZ88_06520 [Verrucomicrobiales bacterium]|nr:hypothetical protein [Verrucomicrobiales bacterium]